jgi:hypothetical protein
MRSITSGIIANRLIRPGIVLIGQRYVNLPIGVKVLSNKSKKCVNCRKKNNQKNNYPYRRERVLIAIRKR